jgi:hypothetical protein
MIPNTNYSGRQPNNTAYVKEFYSGSATSLWTTTLHLNTKVIIPATPTITSLYIPGNLYVDGSIINPSDIYLKDNVREISIEKADELLKVGARQFTLKSDLSKQIHYGFIAQEFEAVFPELVFSKPDKNMANLKAINYLELVPLLVHKVQLMQREIDELKEILHKKLK